MPKNSTVGWQPIWPTKPGTYWFYGWPFGNDADHKPELNLVKIISVSNGVLTVREGTFWDKSEGWKGVFIKAKLPKLPILQSG